MTDSIRHAGRWTLEERFASPWHYLPVEVPPGTGALRVELDYDRADGAVLDLGCFGPGGFRGWSGGARESFVIARDAATPGYLPGELEAGTWQVVIGVHRVPPDGVGYRLTAQTASASLRPSLGLPPAPLAPPAPADRPPRRVLPARSGSGPPLAGRRPAHAHRALGRQADRPRAGRARGPARARLSRRHRPQHDQPPRRAGRRVPAVRDHPAARPGGDDRRRARRRIGRRRLDRLPPGAGRLAGRDRGGGRAAVGQPPVRRAGELDPADAPPPAADRGLALELARPALDHLPLSWWLAWDPAAIPVGGSDWHRPGSDAPPGRPTTWVECEGDQPGDVLDGLRAGRVAISAERDGPVLFRRDDALVAVDADGLTLAGPQGPCARVRGDRATLPGSPGPHRLLDPAGATLALCG